MEKSKINEAADILYNCRINIKRIKKLPNDCAPKSIQEAYAIQDELAQKYLSELQGVNNSYFCGSYFGYGFHEDGLNSGINVSNKL